MAQTSQDPVDALFRSPPDSFVAARDQLAKELRAKGDKEGAAEVKALRRPSVAAWAVNHLAHHHAADLRKAIAAGETLRRAQEDMLAGGDRDQVRRATTARRTAITKLVDTAAAALEQIGIKATEAHRDAIADTIEAASVDDEAALVVESGRLMKELEAPTGFGEMTVVETTRTRKPQPARETTRETATRDRHAKREARIRERDRAEAIEEARRHAKQVAKARSEVERLERELEQARQKLTDLSGKATALPPRGLSDLLAHVQRD